MAGWLKAEGAFLKVVDTQPVIGDIKPGREIGKNPKSKFIFQPCGICQKPRWVTYTNIGGVKNINCQPCNVRTISQSSGAKANREARHLEKINRFESIVRKSKELPDPVVGEIRKGLELGLSNVSKYIYTPCEVCNTPNWVSLYHINRGEYTICMPCRSKSRSGSRSREKSHRWKGGTYTNKNGYKWVTLKPDDPLMVMARKKGSARIQEHRLVMARSLGRPLDKQEVVHHKNGIKNDNRLDNLELTTNGQHALDHHKGYKDGYINGLSEGRTRQVRELRSQIKTLREELSKLKLYKDMKVSSC